MRIYAYKENVPGPDTVLYAAPFFNVTGSSVCLGNARIELPKDLTYEKLLQYWKGNSGLRNSPTWEETGTRQGQTSCW